MPEGRTARLRLHLDADTSRKALHKALVDRGHDVTRTPCEWMPFDAKDRTQLRESSAHERAIFTFNIRDFIALNESEPEHYGIILAAQQSWTLSELIRALDRLLAETDSSMLRNRLIWLSRVA